MKKIYNKKGMIVWFAMLLFLLCSFIYISPSSPKEKSTYNSSQLKKVVTQEGNATRTDYVDEEGKITVAAELGYSTIIVKKTEKSETESYYDDQGEPAVRRYLGYSSILREYDDKRNVTHIRYLNKEGHSVMTTDGYAEEIREYDINGHIIAVYYYDSQNQPVSTEAYGYGRLFDYENGRISRITCIDDLGHPMMTKNGYAIIYRYYYENGKIEREQYFNEKEEPVALPLGHYGVHKEYDENGQESVLTYLDSNGQPANTYKGYATIARTYHANGKVETEKYYDQDGKPFALSEGQYGIKLENDQILYLNQKGQESFNLRTLLYHWTWLVIPLSIVFVIITAIVDIKWNRVFLILYVCIILYLTLMYRYNDHGNNRISFFESYRQLFISNETRADILKNIWLFIPLGAIVYQLYPKKLALLIPILLSILVEVIQYATGIGFCELDDILSNSLGGVIGFYCAKLTSDLIQRINR